MILKIVKDSYDEKTETQEIEVMKDNRDIPKRHKIAFSWFYNRKKKYIRFLDIEKGICVTNDKDIDKIKYILFPKKTNKTIGDDDPIYEKDFILFEIHSVEKYNDKLSIFKIANDIEITNKKNNCNYNFSDFLFWVENKNLIYY